MEMSIWSTCKSDFASATNKAIPFLFSLTALQAALKASWASYPLEYIKLSVYRFIPLWFDIGVAEQYGQQTFIWDDAIILEQAILLVIFILGLCKRGWGLQLIGFSIIVYLVAYLAVQGQLRYTVPVSPGTLVIGSIGLLSGLPHRKS